MLDAHRTGRPLLAFVDTGHPQSSVDAFNVSVVFGIGLVLFLIGVFHGILAIILRLAGTRTSVFQLGTASICIVLVSCVIVVIASPVWYLWYAVPHFTARQFERAGQSVQQAVELPQTERTLALRHLLKEGNELVQVRVCKELAHRRQSATAAAPELMDVFVNSESQQVYVNAYDALEPLGPLLKSHVDELSQLLFAEYDKPIYALSLLRAIGPEARDAIPAIVMKWHVSNDPFDQRACVRAMRAIDANGDACVPLLRELVDESRLQGNEAAFNLISQFGTTKKVVK